MTKRLSRVVVGMLLVAGLTGCKDQVARDALETWGDSVYKWQLRAYHSLCELESRATPPIPAPDRLCPTGDDTDPGGMPPKPPEFD